MRVTSSDRERAVLLAVVGIVFVSWFGGAEILNRKTEEVEEKTEVLAQEYRRIQNVLGRENVYRDESAEYERFYEETLRCFPENITEEDQLLFVADLEREFGIKISTMTCPEPFEVTSLSVPSDSGKTYILMCCPVQFPVSLEFSDWKRFLEYIGEYPEKSRVAAAEGHIDRETGIVEGSVTIYRYGIIEGESEDTEKQLEEG